MPGRTAARRRSKRPHPTRSRMTATQSATRKLMSLPSWALVGAMLGLPAGGGALGGFAGYTAAVDRLDHRITEALARSMQRDDEISGRCDAYRREYIEDRMTLRAGLAEQSRLLEGLRSELTSTAAKAALYQDQMHTQIPELLRAIESMTAPKRR